jgi:hypothetical protein
MSKRIDFTVPVDTVSDGPREPGWTDDSLEFGTAGIVKDVSDGPREPGWTDDSLEFGTAGIVKDLCDERRRAEAFCLSGLVCPE